MEPFSYFRRELSSSKNEKKRKERKKQNNIPKTFVILYFRKLNFLATSFKNFLYFRKELVKAENKKFHHIFCLLREVLEHKHKKFLILSLKISKIVWIKILSYDYNKAFFPILFFYIQQAFISSSSFPSSETFWYLSRDLFCSFSLFSC